MLRWLLVVGLVLAAPAYAKKEVDPAELAATHGLVTARFRPTLPAVMLGVPSYLPPSVTLRPIGGRDDGRDDVALQQREDDPESFGGWIPAGRYRMASWRVSRWPDGPEVDVTAGRLNDLGDLLEVSLGGYDVVLMPLDHPELAAKLDPWLAEVGHVLASKEPLRWQATDVPAPVTIRLQSTAGMYAGGLLMDLMMAAQRRANRTADRVELRAIRSLADFRSRVLEAMPPTRDDATVDEQGRLYFGADLGRIRVREADGQWRTLDTGTIAAITAVEWREGRLLAGSTAGAIHASSDEGRTWQVIRRYDRNETIGDIDWHDGRWLVVTTHRQLMPKFKAYASNQSTVYAGSADDFSDTVVLGRFPQKYRPAFVTWLAPRGELSGEYYFVDAYPDVQRLHLSSGEWTTLKIPGNTERLMASPRTGALTAASGKLFLSLDHGEKWLLLKNPQATARPSAGVMHDASEGWVSHWRNDSMATSVIALYDREKGSGGWRKLGDAPLGCERLLRTAAGEPSLCATVGGSLVRREGEDWVTEFAIR